MGESGYDPAALGREVDVSAELVKRWLSGDEKPLLGQFRDIARVLRRPTATFLLPAAPAAKGPAIAFRHPPGEADRELHTNERHRIREVARLQRIAGWLTDQLGEQPSLLPRLRASDNPERVGERIRSLLDVSLTGQLEWRGESEAVSSWRQALENLGMLVCFLPMGKDAARGFSLFDERAPAIAVNTFWNTPARLFTMLHEFAHLLTRTNSICAEGRSTPSSDAEDLERWCERAAAAALMPSSAISTVLASLGNPRPSLDTAAKLAKRFKVSLKASALRLVTLGHAGWGLYFSVPQGTDAKTGGGGGGGRRRPKIRVDEYGRRITSLVLRGLERNLISPAEAMGFLDVSYRNLEEIEALL
jgi:Zn-dependent peptidase ImmA (M78 family)